MRLLLIFLGFYLGQASAQGRINQDSIPPAPFCDLQILGDLYLSAAGLQETGTTMDQPTMFEGVKNLLESCEANVVNFEGSATEAMVPWESKQYLLKMPPLVPRLLKKVHIDVLTLANNHSMDFGLSGLSDTLAAAQFAGLATVGANLTPEDALKPLRLDTSSGVKICIAAFSSTFPKSFWADQTRGGTTYASPKNIDVVLDQCGQDFKIAIFHWGTERSNEPHLLQKTLAAVAIDSGADLVIGHHPHVLQPLEYYRGKPIIFSIGNFVFNSRPLKGTPEGLSVRLRFPPHSLTPQIRLVPMMVRPDIVGLTPQTLQGIETHEADRIFNNIILSLLEPSQSAQWFQEFSPSVGWSLVSGRK
jgi:poly-gamma-glutamate synthesis protein (capsule biosynthesis protein)